MTSATVTAPLTAPTPLTARRLEVAALIIHAQNCDGTCTDGPTLAQFDAARELLTKHAADGDVVIQNWVTGELADNMVRAFARVAADYDRDMAAYRNGLLHTHGYAIAAGAGRFYCVACTPGGDSNPRELVGWPCLPLTEAGLTPEMASRHVTEQEDENMRRIREAERAARAELPDLDGFIEHDGIKVGYVGDYGDVYALGWHVRAEEVLHAMDSLARIEAGLDGITDDGTTPPASMLRRAWARNTGTGTGAEQWCLETMRATDKDTLVPLTCDDADTFPVTIWDA